MPWIISLKLLVVTGNFSAAFGSVLSKAQSVRILVSAILKFQVLSRLSGTPRPLVARPGTCLLYTSDAADDLLGVALGGRRITQKKKKNNKQQR